MLVENYRIAGMRNCLLAIPLANHFNFLASFAELLLIEITSKILYTLKNNGIFKGNQLSKRQNFYNY